MIHRHKLTNIRCSNCQKLLGKISSGTVEIKCQRCKQINLQSIKNASLECHRASNHEENSCRCSQKPTPLVL